MDGLPNFITHGAPLARFARRSSAIIGKNTKLTLQQIDFNWCNEHITFITKKHNHVTILDEISKFAVYYTHRIAEKTVIINY